MMPRILLAAPASHSGKTTVTCALLQAYQNRGLSLMACKTGPDYIDPMFHTRIIGVKSRNLDPFFFSQEQLCTLLARNVQGCDLTVIEGVMGFYDGIAMTDRASTWHLAQATRTPVLLVVDGRGSALSLAALVEGFRSFRPDSQIGGVILNRISAHLYPSLAHAITEGTGLPVYGYLPTLPQCAIESRHLGLLTAGEITDLHTRLHRLAEAAEQTLDLDGILALAQTAPALPANSRAAEPVTNSRPRIAVAQDAAFCFYYQDALDLLTELGAELVPFSPLKDSILPEDISGLYLGGGYPELYASPLSQNRTMLASIRNAIEGGLPTLAECGGFLYLHSTLEDGEGKSYPMAGILPHGAYRTERLGRFGYITLTAEEDSLLFQKGWQLPAHEFHYWQSENPGEALAAQKPLSPRNWRAGICTPTLYAGFPHMHLCAAPQVAERYIHACATYQQNQENFCESSIIPNHRPNHPTD